MVVLLAMKNATAGAYSALRGSVLFRMVRRRNILRAGAATLLAGAGALAWRAQQQGVFETGEGPAYEAWTQWNDGPAHSPQRLLRSAILAANPHNSQPWRFAVRPGWIDLHADRSRHLGSIDPF